MPRVVFGARDSGWSDVPDVDAGVEDVGIAAVNVAGLTEMLLRCSPSLNLDSEGSVVDVWTCVGSVEGVVGVAECVAGVVVGLDASVEEA